MINRAYQSFGNLKDLYRVERQEQLKREYCAKKAAKRAKREQSK